MMNELCGIFEQKQFKKMMTDAEGIYIYYMDNKEKAEVIIIFDCDKNKILNVNIISRLKSQIMWKLMNAGLRDIEYLCLYAGSETNTDMKELCIEEDTNWIIDKEHGRLIIYENQKSDFMNLRLDIEKSIETALNNTHNERNWYPALCNFILVVTNVLIFLLCEWQLHVDNKLHLYEFGALDGTLVRTGEYYRLLTSMFLHLDISHLFNNMLILFYLGNYLERIINKTRYVVLYFLSGIIAGLISMEYNIITGSNAVSVGASGAVFGVAGALAYIIIINKGKVENISRRQIVIFIILSLYGGFTGQNVDNAAHIGGLIAGFILAVILYHKNNGDEKRSRE